MRATPLHVTWLFPASLRRGSLSSYLSVKEESIMPLNIKNPEADRLVRELTQLTGETITGAVITAMQERLERERSRRAYSVLREELRRIRERYQSLPLQDARSAEEILGYDEAGLPR
jgi:antitoxin VapB